MSDTNERPRSPARSDRDSSSERGRKDDDEDQPRRDDILRQKEDRSRDYENADQFRGSERFSSENLYQTIKTPPRSISPSRESPRSISPSRESPRSRSPGRESPRSRSPGRESPRSRSPSRESPRSRSSRDSPRSRSPYRDISPRSRSRSPKDTPPRSRSPVRSTPPRSRSPVQFTPPGSRSPVQVRSPSPPVPMPRTRGFAEPTKPQNQGQRQGQNVNDLDFEVHSAFQGAGQKPGIEIWRIEQFEPVRQKASTYGDFYTGDCYIVLSTTTKHGANKFDYALHFWLGNECTQDEAGAVAISAVELDEFGLGGAAVQYREVQSHETKLFLAYFKKNIRYLAGGVKSGFKHVDPTKYEKRLFQLKGKKNIRIAQVPCMCGSLNQGDTFVLDDNTDIYVWIGPGSTKKEKLCGAQYARLLRDDEKGGKAHIRVVEDWRTNSVFYKALGSRDKAIKAADEHDDEDIIRKLDQDILLFRFTEQGAREVGQRPLRQTMLVSDSCFVLDSGPTGIYLWTGKKTSSNLRKSIWKKVQDFMDTRGYPFYLPVVRVVDGGEPALFKQYFQTWQSHDEVDDKPPQSNIAKQDYSGAKGLDIKGLHTRRPTADEWMPDDGRGKIKVWRIENRECVSVPEKAYGVFFGGDSYVILYTYVKNHRDAHIIYFWQGTKSSQDEKAAAALQSVALDDKLGGEAVQIRVIMLKEPAHFMKIFNNRVVYFMGGHVSGFRSLTDYEDFDPKEAHMFQVKGDKRDGIRAIQVPARGSVLNSNDIFIVDSERKAFAWIGKYANQDEAELAERMLTHIAPAKGEPIIVEEGRESGIFWSILGGEEPYYQGQQKKTQELQVEPRLFHCTMVSGKFTVEEIVDFTQDDLNEDDVMLLDTYDEIFIWVGKNAKEFEKKESYKTAYTYLSVDPSGRNSENTLIVVLKQGVEPPHFTGCFLGGWDTELWNRGYTFSEIIKQLGDENSGITLLKEEVGKYTSYYEYDELKRRVPPEGVDVNHKEMYLSPDDFAKVFGMAKEHYEDLPEWKRIGLKRQNSLF